MMSTAQLQHKNSWLATGTTSWPQACLEGLTHGIEAQRHLLEGAPVVKRDWGNWVGWIGWLGIDLG